ncbi:uncharacterized protein Z518_02312 [Rhinocladiella mackenziei CBS 650.93]|uniref:Uncharacterized protein n=1 Tax=Rhinocladiella mackenziei CBS 650.93 TaxID=1442369 RepID=A0A0D2IP74_9EURO|nr:uncharacterized protein Z518_02312 [Rhinocladiella mackenziei CBS 650.93]KIX07659.1 hypothetical protein Z518_02312 [Rhinocladiella mackenziei CBS 650.93]
MVFLIHFTNEIATPMSYHWGHETYKACADCVRAHEVRACLGETIVRFQLCEKHVEASKDLTFDSPMLNEIRRTIHALYSEMGKTDIPTKELQENVKITFDADPTTAQDTVKNKSRPYPTVVYVHDKGCVYVDKPDILIKKLAEVAKMDQFARKRLNNINTLIDIHYRLDAGKNPETELRRFLDYVSEHHPHFLPGRGDSEPNPELEAEFNLVCNRWTAAGEFKQMKEEKSRLEACLATSTLAKAMYFKG